LYGNVATPESISADYDIPLTEVTKILIEWLIAHPREPGQSS
jgi:hypothetical protein